MARVAKDDSASEERPDLGPCWRWTGSKDRDGYGIYNHRQNATRYVHRLMYELVKGPIQPGLVMDHLCRLPICCNPDHVEPVTQAENVRRGRATEVSRRLAAARTHCPNGHPYEGDNFTVKSRGPKRGRRRCRVCARALSRKYRAAQKESQ
ncbi:HNH endonuclease signature motif containing protein [Streptomyces sp. ECR3.8]|uniref:HNH endonuclease signature motif containing protein n=1 Tax=Streptomyces sp. ECR3.8 TaxID=3461009 RepID=UPI004041337D